MRIEFICGCAPCRTIASRLSRITIAFCLLAFAGSAHAQSLRGYQAPNKPPTKDDTPVAVKVTRGELPMQKLYGNLRADATKTKRLGPLATREKQRQRREKFLRIGVVRTLETPLEPLSDSAFYTVSEGDVRVAGLVSEGAVTVRVQFKGMSLPPGARVFVYSATNPDDFYGPYEGHGPSGDGEFWTPPVRGDGIVVEYFTPAGTKPVESPFKVIAIGHGFKDLSVAASSGSCEIEVASPWTQVARSVGMIDFVTRGSLAACTGTLLNDQAQDQKPYFLTANHCISTQTEAQSANVYWNYNSGEDPTIFPTTHGTNLLVTGTSSDFTLLLLTGSVPSGLFFSGWDATNFAGSAAAVGIHHPNGSHKRMSAGTATQPNPSDCEPGEQCLRVNWTPTGGVMEAGSSGSGIWIGDPTNDPANAKLIGDLTGGVSACGAAAADLWDSYGRFSVTYPSIAGFLTTSCVTSVSPTSQSFAASSGGGSFTVNAPAGCAWSASATAAFITITNGSSGNGNGTVSFTVDTNNGLQRSGSIVVGKQVFNITQASGGVCAPTPIALGETKNGTLTSSSCPLDDGSVLDAYSFSATAGTQVSLTMTSSAFDTFLVLNNPDGSILSFDDDGGGGSNSRIPATAGFITLPVTGTYTIWANGFFPANHTPEPGVGSYSLTLTERPTTTLTVASSNPDSGVTVTYNPADRSGLTSGNTQFTRTVYQNVTFTLIAPGVANGNIFRKWQRDGADYSSTTVTTITMDNPHTLTAIYTPPQNFVLTVGSSNPASGVSISVSPNDNSNLGGGDTQFTRTYQESTSVLLDAPGIAPNGNIFQKWQRDGVDQSSRLISVFMSSAHTVTAFYVSPVTTTLTVNSSNPGSGVPITVTPADNNGASDGTAPFTRSYSQGTSVTLTAPAAAPNGNIFERWVMNGNNLALSRSANLTITTTPATVTAIFSTTPNLFIEQGTTNTAVALNSVTFQRGPFRVLDPLNFSGDGHTRIIIFTSDLGLPAGPNKPEYQLGVQVPSIALPVEAVGPLTGVPGLTGTYIVVRLPDNMPTGALQLSVLFHGVSGGVATLNIIP